MMTEYIHLEILPKGNSLYLIASQSSAHITMALKCKSWTEIKSMPSWEAVEIHGKLHKLTLMPSKTIVI